MSHKSKSKLYAPTFCKFLLAVLDVDYSVDDIQQGRVPNDILKSITPKMIVGYFNMACYGTTNPQETDYPKLKQSNTLLYWKKVISNYMMMSNSAWDEISKRGNPTKSKEVNYCIRCVMKAEVGKQGVGSTDVH